MSLGTDLAAAVALITTDASYLRAIVQGPAAGTTSLVTLPNGAVIKTLARIAQEVSGGFLPLAGGTLTGSLYVPYIEMRNTSVQFRMVDTATNQQGGLNVNNTVANTVFMGSYTSNPLALGTYNAAHIHVSTIGQMGIRTLPQADLHFKGAHFLQDGFQPILSMRDLNDANKGVRLQNAGGVLFFHRDLGGGGAFVESFRIDANGHLLPGADGTQNFGSASRRGNTAYFTTSAINTSDARQKRWGSLLSAQPGLVKVGLMIPEILGTFQFLASIADKGQAAWDALSSAEQATTTPTELGHGLARWHIGLTVQELVAIFDVVRQDFPEMPTPAQLGLYGRDPIKTKIARTETRERPTMIVEPYTDFEYEPSATGDYFIARPVPKTRSVPAPPVLMPVMNPNGTPRLVKIGERPTGLLDNEGRPIMEPVMEPEMRPVAAMEPYQVTVFDEVDQGEYVLSTRPEQIHYLCIGAAHIARKALEARVATLEQAAA